MIERTIDESTLMLLSFKDAKFHDYLRNGPSQCSYFLERLYGTNPPGWLLVWTGKGGKRYPISTMANNDIVEEIIATSQTSDVMISVGLRRNRPENETLKDEKEIVALPGLWMVIPIKGPTHQEKYIPSSIGEGLKFLKSQRMKPDIIIDTGYELQAHWNFEHLHVFGVSSESIFDCDRSFEEIKEMSHDFQQEMIKAGVKCRWMLPDTSSLLTKLRVPGTFNFTLFPPKPVTILEPKKHVWKIY